jgi:carbonic anhydrase/acetyltransferase-like protein (isoleucine patch superfamily)
MKKDISQTVLKPKIHHSVFVAEGARIFGDVEIGKGSSVWFNAVIRGDEGKIVIGKNTNIQDNCVIHSDQDVAVIIGDNVTIGHGAIVRGCRIGNNSMIGMNATIMNNVDIGEASIVGTNAMVSYNKKFPPRALVIGIPAKMIRLLTDEELQLNEKAGKIYRDLMERYNNKAILGMTCIIDKGSGEF